MKIVEIKPITIATVTSVSNDMGMMIAHWLIMKQSEFLRDIVRFVSIEHATLLPIVSQMPIQITEWLQEEGFVRITDEFKKISIKVDFNKWGDAEHAYNYLSPVLSGPLHDLYKELETELKG